MSLILSNVSLPQGQFGFTVTPPQGATAFVIPVLNASAAGLGTIWGIHLAAWTGGKPRETLGLGTPTLRVRITWGGGGSGGSGVEVIEMDYPTTGTTVSVHGNTVRVELLGSVNPSDVVPTLSGWLTEGPTSNRDMSATLTEATVVVAGGSGASFVVPARARAYRLIWCQDGDAAHLIATQLTGNGTPRTAGIDEVGNVIADSLLHQGDVLLAENRKAWYPLAPDAATLVVNNTSFDNPFTQFRIQWILELG